MRHFDVLIVGASHAGAQAAAALRQGGFPGSIAIASDEIELPYERPPLSKEYLAGEKPFDRILIRPASFWAEKKIELLLGITVADVEPDRREATIGRAERYSYGDLIWAAGGAPRKLTCTGHDLAGVHSVRSRADVDRMIAELPDTRRVVVIGAGYIGLEAAAVLTKLGVRVTLVEAQDRVLARVAGATISRHLEALHRANGVDIRLASSVECIESLDGRASAVRLRTGETLPCDMVIVGIGIEPAVEPLRRAGALCADGVVVDSMCRTSLGHVYAIGDCAMHPNTFSDGEKIRIESVQNASDQGNVAAKNILGKSTEYEAVPWFWSNQYDLRLQTVGLSRGFDTEVVRGNPHSNSFSVVYLRNGRVCALDCVNATKDYVQGRGLVLAKMPLCPEQLANADVPLKELVDRSPAAA